MAKATVKSRHEIELVRESCRIVADVLRLLKATIRPGITTKELDTLAEEYIRSQGGVPAFKGYGFDKTNPYPATICASIDDEVVHGIPGTRTLYDGEIISIDVGVKKNNYYGDGAWTFAVGEISPEMQRLMNITEASLYKGIEQARAGNRVRDISHAVQELVESSGYSVVRALVGHGVGRQLHEEPTIPNYVEDASSPRLKSGLTVAIEPMVNAGTYEVSTDDDGWTVRTKDGLPSAHFEHTVVVLESGAEILTV